MHEMSSRAHPRGWVMPCAERWSTLGQYVWERDYAVDRLVYRY